MAGWWFLRISTWVACCTERRSRTRPSVHWKLELTYSWYARRKSTCGGRTQRFCTEPKVIHGSHAWWRRKRGESQASRQSRQRCRPEWRQPQPRKPWTGFDGACGTSQRKYDGAQSSGLGSVLGESRRCNERHLRRRYRGRAGANPRARLSVTTGVAGELSLPLPTRSAPCGFAGNECLGNERGRPGAAEFHPWRTLCEGGAGGSTARQAGMRAGGVSWASAVSPERTEQVPGLRSQVYMADGRGGNYCATGRCSRGVGFPCGRHGRRRHGCAAGSVPRLRAVSPPAVWADYPKPRWHWQLDSDSSAGQSR